MTVLIAAHLPTACVSMTQADLNNVLNQGLINYFEIYQGKAVRVSFDQLSIVSTVDNKYVWVKVFSEEQLIQQGVARLLLKDDHSCVVTHFLDKSKLNKNPKAVIEVVPPKYAREILLRAGLPDKLVNQIDDELYFAEKSRTEQANLRMQRQLEKIENKSNDRAF